MAYEDLSDDEIQQKLDDAILKANPEKLTDDELDRRLELRGHKSPSNLFLDGVLDAAGTVGKVMDYPAGIARAGADAVTDIFSGKPVSEAAGKIGSALQGDAPSSQDLARKAGIPDSPIPGTTFPQSAAAGLVGDLVTGVGEAKVIGEGAKAASRGVRSLLGADEQALKAVGTPPKQIEGMIKKSGFKEPISESQKYSKYVQDNITSPFAGTQKLLEKAGTRLEEVGARLGEIRKKNGAAVQLWLKSPNPGKEAAMAEYLDGTFTPRTSIQRIYQQIDDNIPDPDYAEQVKDIIGRKMNALNLKYNGKEIPIEDISKLKSAWQREVNFGKEMPDYSVREDAFNFLQREADRAIDNEINFGDKYLSGSDLAKHSKLKEEYGMLKNMTGNLRKKLSREMARPKDVKLNPLNWDLNPIGGTVGQSTVASLPNSPLSVVPGPKSMVGGAGIGALKLPTMREGQSNEPTIEGFPMSAVKPTNPMEAMTFEKQIQKSELSNVDKAKRINLLRKHGLIYIGQ